MNDPQEIEYVEINEDEPTIEVVNIDPSGRGADIIETINVENNKFEGELQQRNQCKKGTTVRVENLLVVSDNPGPSTSGGMITPAQLNSVIHPEPRVIPTAMLTPVQLISVIPTGSSGLSGTAVTPVQLLGHGSAMSGMLTPIQLTGAGPSAATSSSSALSRIVTPVRLVGSTPAGPSPLNGIISSGQVTATRHIASTPKHNTIVNPPKNDNIQNSVTSISRGSKGSPSVTVVRKSKSGENQLMDLFTLRNSSMHKAKDGSPKVNTSAMATSAQNQHLKDKSARDNLEQINGLSAKNTAVEGISNSENPSPSTSTSGLKKIRPRNLKSLLSVSDTSSDSPKSPKMNAVITPKRGLTNLPASKSHVLIKSTNPPSITPVKKMGPLSRGEMIVKLSSTQKAPQKNSVLAGKSPSESAEPKIVQSSQQIAGLPSTTSTAALPAEKTRTGGIPNLETPSPSSSGLKEIIPRNLKSLFKAPGSTAESPNPPLRKTVQTSEIVPTNSPASKSHILTKPANLPNSSNLTPGSNKKDLFPKSPKIIENNELPLDIIDLDSNSSQNFDKFWNEELGSSPDVSGTACKGFPVTAAPEEPFEELTAGVDSEVFCSVENGETIINLDGLPGKEENTGSVSSQEGNIKKPKGGGIRLWPDEVIQPMRPGGETVPISVNPEEATNADSSLINISENKIFPLLNDNKSAVTLGQVFDEKNLIDDVFPRTYFSPSTAECLFMEDSILHPTADVPKKEECDEEAATSGIQAALDQACPTPDLNIPEASKAYRGPNAVIQVVQMADGRAVEAGIPQQRKSSPEPSPRKRGGKHKLSGGGSNSCTSTSTSSTSAPTISSHASVTVSASSRNTSGSPQTINTSSILSTANNSSTLSTARTSGTSQTITTSCALKTALTSGTSQTINTTSIPSTANTSGTPRIINTSITLSTINTSSKPSTANTSSTPCTAHTSGTPQTINTSSIPNTANTSSTPQNINTSRTPITVHASGTSQTINTSSTPSTPQTINTSSTLSTANTSGTPQTINTSSKPSTAHTSGTPRTINTSSIPNTANTSSTPQKINTSRTPITVHASGTSQTINTSSTPSTPQTINTSSTPNTANTSSKPSTAHTSGTPRTINPSCTLSTVHTSHSSGTSKTSKTTVSSSTSKTTVSSSTSKTTVSSSTSKTTVSSSTCNTTVSCSTSNATVSSRTCNASVYSTANNTSGTPSTTHRTSNTTVSSTITNTSIVPRTSHPSHTSVASTTTVSLSTSNTSITSSTSHSSGTHIISNTPLSLSTGNTSSTPCASHTSSTPTTSHTTSSPCTSLTPAASQISTTPASKEHSAQNSRPKGTLEIFDVDNDIVILEEDSEEMTPESLGAEIGHDKELSPGLFIRNPYVSLETLSSNVFTSCRTRTSKEMMGSLTSKFAVEVLLKKAKLPAVGKVYVVPMKGKINDETKMKLKTLVNEHCSGLKEEELLKVIRDNAGQKSDPLTAVKIFVRNHSPSTSETDNLLPKEQTPCSSIGSSPENPLPRKQNHPVRIGPLSVTQKLHSATHSAVENPMQGGENGQNHPSLTDLTPKNPLPKEKHVPLSVSFPPENRLPGKLIHTASVGPLPRALKPSSIVDPAVQEEDQRNIPLFKAPPPDTPMPRKQNHPGPVGPLSKKRKLSLSTASAPANPSPQEQNNAPSKASPPESPSPRKQNHPGPVGPLSKKLKLLSRAASTMENSSPKELNYSTAVGPLPDKLEEHSLLAATENRLTEDQNQSSTFSPPQIILPRKQNHPGPVGPLSRKRKLFSPTISRAANPSKEEGNHILFTTSSPGNPLLTKESHSSSEASSPRKQNHPGPVGPLSKKRKLYASVASTSLDKLPDHENRPSLAALAPTNILPRKQNHPGPVGPLSKKRALSSLTATPESPSLMRGSYTYSTVQDSSIQNLPSSAATPSENLSPRKQNHPGPVGPLSRKRMLSSSLRIARVSSSSLESLSAPESAISLDSSSAPGSPSAPECFSAQRSLFVPECISQKDQNHPTQSASPSLPNKHSSSTASLPKKPLRIKPVYPSRISSRLRSHRRVSNKLNPLLSTHSTLNKRVLRKKNGPTSTAPQPIRQLESQQKCSLPSSTTSSSKNTLQMKLNRPVDPLSTSIKKPVKPTMPIPPNSSNLGATSQSSMPAGPSLRSSTSAGVSAEFQGSSTLKKENQSGSALQTLFTVKTAVNDIRDREELEQLCQVFVQSIYNLKNLNTNGSMAALTVLLGQPLPDAPAPPTGSASGLKESSYIEEDADICGIRKNMPATQEDFLGNLRLDRTEKTHNPNYVKSGETNENKQLKLTVSYSRDYPRCQPENLFTKPNININFINTKLDDFDTESIHLEKFKKDVMRLEDENTYLKRLLKDKDEQLEYLRKRLNVVKSVCEDIDRPV